MSVRSASSTLSMGIGLIGSPCKQKSLVHVFKLNGKRSYVGVKSIDPAPPISSNLTY